MRLLASVEYHRRVKDGIAASVGAVRPVSGTRGQRTRAALRAASEASGKVLGYGAYLTAHSAGRLCALKMPGSRDDKTPGGLRGKVHGFSSASRLRLMRLIHTVERTAALPHFVTLTFPDFFPTVEDAKRLLDVLFKRWRRRWPKTSALWRLELIDRKSGASRGQIAPHFHLLVWGDFSPTKARDDWFEVNGSDDYAHFRHGTDVAKCMEDWKQAACYCAKYCAKESNVVCEQGRVWGIANKAALPVDREPVRVRLTLPEAFALRRLIRKAIHAKTGKTARHAQSLYTSAPDDFLRWVCFRRGVPVKRSQ